MHPALLDYITFASLLSVYFRNMAELVDVSSCNYMFERRIMSLLLL
jgi:hypothetical protein